MNKLQIRKALSANFEFLEARSLLKYRLLLPAWSLLLAVWVHELVSRLRFVLALEGIACYDSTEIRFII